MTHQEMSYSSDNVESTLPILHISNTMDKPVSFASLHHMHHAIAKALYIGEATRLAPTDIPAFFAPTKRTVVRSLQATWTVEANDDQKSEMLWLVTEPFERWREEDRYQQLQLVTSSRDQGWISTKGPPSYLQSWFELGIRSPSMDNSDGTPTLPKNPFLDGDIGRPKLDPITGSELRWHSHNNLLFAPSFVETEGKIIDPDHDLWSHLGPTDMVAVYMCARARGRKNRCIGGSLQKFRSRARPGLPVELVRKILRLAGFLAPRSRRLPTEYIGGKGPWKVTGMNSDVRSELWMVSQPLSTYMLQNIAQVQLETISSDQGWSSEDGAASQSFFGLGILQKLPGGVYGPRPQPGTSSQVGHWLSHHNARVASGYMHYSGNKYQANEPPLSLMGSGDRLVVWMQVQYLNWENNAKEGTLNYWTYFEPTLLGKYQEKKAKPVLDSHK